MARLILAIVAFVLAIVVTKMVIIALVIAGLIFRTKETIGLLAIGGLMTFVAAFPVVGFSLLAVLAVGAIIKACSKSEPTDDAKLAIATRLDDPAE